MTNTKLSRTQIIKIIVVCIHKYVQQNWEGFHTLIDKEQKKVITELKSSEEYKRTIKFMEEVFQRKDPTLSYTESNGFGFVIMKYSRTNRYNDEDFKFTFPVSAAQLPKPKKIEVLGITIAEQYISDSWEQKVRSRLNTKINEIEVDQILKNKKFTGDLNEFMSKLGLPSEICTVAAKQLQVK